MRNLVASVMQIFAHPLAPLLAKCQLQWSLTRGNFVKGARRGLIPNLDTCNETTEFIFSANRRVLWAE